MVAGPRGVLMSARDASDYGARLRDAPVLGFVVKSELTGTRFATLVGRDEIVGHIDRR